ncbi:extensin-like [Lycium ferocissimum]|uniref:extensin-like n=1 Tax=Lycium ferocissimum TaxID=112874 RepID=UPI0028149A2C|nr:extensin-like [Lycium ferocissimum]
MQHDEHIARPTQEIEDLRSELNRVRDLTNLSVTLQSPPPEPRTVAPNPPRFSSLESPVPEHFPPQNTASANNNFPPITPVNPPNQSQVHTPYIPLPTSTNPPPTTTPLNQPNQLPTNTAYNTPPPVQNTPTVQTYPTQHIQGAHFATPNTQYVPPVYAAETQAYTNPKNSSSGRNRLI